MVAPDWLAVLRIVQHHQDVGVISDATHKVLDVDKQVETGRLLLLAIVGRLKQKNDFSVRQGNNVPSNVLSGEQSWPSR